MGSVIVRVQNNYESLSNAERKVADYFLENPENVFKLPIKKLALESDVSQVTWVRFAKSVGYEGLKDLKKNLIDEYQSDDLDSPSTNYIFTDISGFEDYTQLSEGIRNSTILAVNETVDLLTSDKIKEIAELMISANTIMLFGIGASAIVAEDFHEKLIRIGKHSYFSRDLHVQLTYAANLEEGDIAFFISNSGNSKDLIDIIDTLNKDAISISMTKFNNNEIAKKVKYQIYTSSPEVSLRSGAMSSRIAQLTAIDILFTTMASKDYDNIENKLTKSYRSCLPRKIN